MIKNDIYNTKQKCNKYLEGIDMKTSDSKLRYDIEGYYNNNPFITKCNMYSKGVTRKNIYQNMKEGTTRKQIIDNEQMKNSIVSVNKVDVTVDTYSSADSNRYLVTRNDITEEDSDK